MHNYVSIVGVVGMKTCTCDVVILISGVVDLPVFRIASLFIVGMRVIVLRAQKFRFKNDIAYSPYLIITVPRVSRT